MPSPHHILPGAIAPPDAHPPTDQQAHRPRLKSGDVCVGCIVWLPPRKDNEQPILCKREGCCGGEVLQDEGYNHPVVVLSIRQSEDSRVRGDIVCSVACVTTFSDTPLPAYLKKRKRRRHYQASIPIIESGENSVHSVDLGSLKKLVLEEHTLRKQSYVRLEHTYEVASSTLAQYSWKSCRAYKMRLSKFSYDVLMEELGLVPEIFEETATLYETETQRLSALANPVNHRPDVVPARALEIIHSSAPSHPISEHFTTYNSLPSISAVRYNAISTTPTPRYLSCSHRYVPVSSNLPDSSDENSCSLSLKYFLGVVVLGSLFWWRYSRL